RRHGARGLSAAGMPTLPDRPLRLLFTAFAAAFAGTGFLFFCFPDGTIRTLNAAGGLVGFPPAPPSDLRFWLSLAAADLVLVTLRPAAIARAPRGRSHLMPILAAGKATSSLTCVGYFVASEAAFVYLLNALVDGSLALMTLGAWVWVQLTSEAAAARDPALLRAGLDALVPLSAALATGAAGIDVHQALHRFFASLPP